MKKSVKIILAAVAAALLVFVYWWGGNSPGLQGWAPSEAPSYNDTADVQKQETIQQEPEKQNETTAEEEAEPPKTIETQEEKATDEVKHTCTLSVRCDTILNNMDWLAEEKRFLVPSNAVIYAPKKVEFNDGDTVFDVLLRQMRDSGIHMEYVNTPAFDSVYIEGINNLYEFDCGELSGWMYKVNGVFPNYSCSLYKLNDGDVVEWVYSCDLGKDVGGGSFQR